MILKALSAMDNWFSAPGKKNRWRSWLGHTLIVLALAFALGVLVGIAIYAWREGEQAYIKHKAGIPQDATDNLLDIVIPMIVLAIVTVIFGWR